MVFRGHEEEISIPETKPRFKVAQATTWYRQISTHDLCYTSCDCIDRNSFAKIIAYLHCEDVKFSIAQLLYLTAAFAVSVAIAKNVQIAILGVVGSICFAMMAYPFAVLTSPQKDTYLDIRASKFVRFLNVLLIVAVGVLATTVLLTVLAFPWFIWDAL